MAFDVGGSKKKGVRPVVNVTPLVDVVLVLLVIFMVITPMMVKQFWLHVPKPEAAATATPPEEGPVPVVLTVRADGTLRINKDSVVLAELPARLERIFAARKDRILFFDAEDAVPYGRAVEVLDKARGGGAAHVAVLTEAARP